MNADPMKRCGAKTRAGTPCKRWPMPNGRCKLHGGMSTGAPGNRNGAKPGSIYSKYLTDEEQRDFDAVSIGTVEHELRLMRTRLKRALKEEAEGVERKTPWRDIINTIAGRIESLERTQKLLRADDSPDDRPAVTLNFNVRR